jgi:hexosaminidase
MSFSESPDKFIWHRLALLLCAFSLVSCGLPASTATLPATPPAVMPSPTPPATSTPPIAVPRLDMVIPKPVSAQAGGGIFFLTDSSSIYVDPGSAELKSVGQYLADHLKSSTGFDLQVREANGKSPGGSLVLTLSGADPRLGPEGYELIITSGLVTVRANQPAGLFYGVQTIRQLLPAAIDSSSVKPGPWAMGTGTVVDSPRFAWRGTMLDVSRHFFTVQDVTRYIDLLAYYKINRLHLHLSDDQGWRIQINRWPNLSLIGGSTEVGDTPGGYFTQAEYAELVEYARQRYIMVIPEIEMPGHVSAAQFAYPELTCGENIPLIPTDISVGYSSLCVDKPITYTFIGDVIAELAALTPGPYIHIGGDEAAHTSTADYIQFVNHVQAIVQENGKQVIGWEDIAQATLVPASVVQHWNPWGGYAGQAVRQGAKVIMSPGDRAYMDMKYTASTPLGLQWAGFISVETGYDWDPATVVGGVSESDILGVEAPLWSETLNTLEDIEYMAFPRLLGYAEIGWTPQSDRGWDEYKLRLAAQGSRLEALGINYYQSPEIPWP